MSAINNINDRINKILDERGSAFGFPRLGLLKLYHQGKLKNRYFSSLLMLVSFGLGSGIIISLISKTTWLQNCSYSLDPTSVRFA